MGIPLLKVVLTALRLTLRPINNVITRKFKNGTSRDSHGFRFFVWSGNRANVYEVKMNRLMIGSKGLGDIPDLHTDMAFNKGVEWFAEIFFFYGVLFSIVGYEMWKAQV
jgi:hypothetical protein